MKIRPRLVLKVLGALVALLLIVGFGAPFLSADQYSARLQNSLSRALGRQVEFLQPVRFNLFKGPGFSVADSNGGVAVVIHEDPSIGGEPLAYMEAMEVRPSIWSLLGGRFVIASIRLEGATINLTKSGGASESGRWNFLSFVNRSVMSAAPAIHVRDGRINFNFGGTKSVFYLTETDFDLSPPGSLGGGWSLSCSAKPARTDRAAQGLGSFTVKGRWFVAPERVDLDVVFDHSGLDEITALFRGQSGAVHGTVSSRLHLGGPINNIGIAGRLNVEDVHRWDLMPTSGHGWPFDIRGRLDVIGQELELQSNSPGNAPLPLWIRFRAADFLAQPHWALTANWNRFPVGPILELARHMGADLPPKLQLAGVMDGAIGISGQGIVQGSVAFQDASLTIPDSPAVRFEHASILFDGDHVRLSPAVARMADEDAAAIEAEYAMNTGTLDVTVSTESMKVASLRAQAAVPWLEQLRSGEFNGQLKYHREGEEAGWKGSLQLNNAELPIPGLADPLQVASAHGQIDGAHVTLDRMEAQAGKVAFTGSYAYEPGAPRPHHLRVHAERLDAADLEAELRPTLSRSNGIIARALGRTSVPDWMEQRALDGTIQVDDLLLAGSHLQNVRAKLVWDVARVQLENLQAKLDRAAITGNLSINLRGARPVYKLTGTVKGITWQAGKLDGQGTLETSGAGLQLLANLTSEGVFTAGGLDFGSLTGRSLSGNYSMAWATTAPKLRLTGLNLKTEEDSYTGKGGTQDDGRLLLVLANGAKELRVSGRFDKLRVEEAR
jgi:hypothetical protein